MADHRVPSQQANPISAAANAYPHPAFNQLQGQVRRFALLTVQLIVIRSRLTMCIVL